MFIMITSILGIFFYISNKKFKTIKRGAVIQLQKGSDSDKKLLSNQILIYFNKNIIFSLCYQPVEIGG